MLQTLAQLQHVRPHFVHHDLTPSASISRLSPIADTIAAGDDDLQVLVALHEDGIGALGLFEQPDLGEALEDLFPDDGELQLGQAVADAAVDAEAERQMVADPLVPGHQRQPHGRGGAGVELGADPGADECGDVGRRLVVVGEAVRPAFEQLSRAFGLLRTIEAGPPASLDWLRTRFTKLETRLSGDGTEQWLNWVIRLPGSGFAGSIPNSLKEAALE